MESKNPAAVDVLASLRRGDLVAARSLAQRLQQQRPRDPAGWLLESEVSRVAGDIRSALSLARRSIEVAAPTTRAWLQIAALLRIGRNWPDAEAALQKAAETAVAGEDFSAVGDAFTRIGQQTKALAAYEEALRICPDQLRYVFNRAALRRFVGDFSGAEADYDRVIALNPADNEAWLNRSDLRIQSPEQNHIAALEARVQQVGQSTTAAVPLHYALAKEYEDLGRYPESWAQLTAGSALRRRHLQYDIATDLATVGWLREAFPDGGSEVHGHSSDEPIFIVGMPRTGSTLLEGILGASPAVQPAGELDAFAAAVVAGAGKMSGIARPSRQELIAASAKLDFAALGADYLDRTRSVTGAKAHFTDKMPLNYLYCGLIRRALPRSRILHLTRHPLATGYAVYRTLFDQGYPFSYELKEIAEYYIGYRRLMDHWRAAHPGAILDVPYERLVTEPANEMQRVFDFCGLDWNPAFLDTRMRTRESTTASASQVRRPIYASSIALWRNYADHLAPLAERLKAAGIEFD